MRTGTPPRLEGKSIRYDGLLTQPSDNPPSPFSFLNEAVAQKVQFNLTKGFHHMFYY